LNHDNDNAGELLIGAPAIAAALGIRRRQVYKLQDAGILPTFKLGGSVAARRSTLTAWLAEQEQKARTAA
jgi:predicted DNA-binding transcriptional regulator AlpA